MKIIKTILACFAKIFSHYKESVVTEYPVTDEEGNIVYYEICLIRSPRVIRMEKPNDNDKLNSEYDVIEQK